MHTSTNIPLVLTVNIITFIFGLPTNMLAFVVFAKKVRQNATPVNLLLLGLTCSDLIFLLFLPLKIKEAVDGFHWNLPKFLCPISGLIFFGTIYSSTLFLTALSVERYLGVAFPIQYKRCRRPLYAVLGSVAIWIVTMSHCSIVFYMQYHEHSQHQDTHLDNHSCYEDFSEEQLKILLPFRLELCIVLFLIPFLICCFCYINIIYILSRLPNTPSKKRIRAITLAITTLLVFVVCFAPFNASHLVGYVTGKSPQWRKHALLTSTFNACLDPFIYYFSSSALRGTFSNILSRLSARLGLHCYSGHTHQNTANPVPLEDHTQSTDNLR